uniref:Uncharacterized protein n=1 Tax=Siphoviridae sp. ctRg81 TaxID=2826336 RepID=A0A8S5NID9_9CAUD|nr:MAG TPA: hypothetical protein [Siphoviridae sp. ctRg81]
MIWLFSKNSILLSRSSIFLRSFATRFGSLRFSYIFSSIG